MLHQKNLKTMMKNYLKICNIILLTIILLSSCEHSIFSKKEVIDFYVENCVYNKIDNERCQVKVFGFSEYQGLKEETIELDTYFNACNPNSRSTIERIYYLWKSKDIPDEKILKLKISFYSGRIIKSEIVNYPILLKEKENKDEEKDGAIRKILVLIISIAIISAIIAFIVNMNWYWIRSKYNLWKKIRSERKMSRKSKDPLYDKLIQSGYNENIVRTIISQERKNLGLNVLLIGLILVLSGCGNELCDINKTVDFYVERAQFIPDNGRHTISGYDDIILDGFIVSDKRAVTVPVQLREYEQRNKENYELLNKIYNKLRYTNFKDGEILQVRANFYRHQLFEMKTVYKDSVLLSKTSAVEEITKTVSPELKGSKNHHKEKKDVNKVFLAASIPFMGLLMLIIVVSLSLKIFNYYVKFKENKKLRLQNKLERKLIKFGYSQEIISKIIREELYLLQE